MLLIKNCLRLCFVIVNVLRIAASNSEGLETVEDDIMRKEVLLRKTIEKMKDDDENQQSVKQKKYQITYDVETDTIRNLRIYLK